MSFLNGGQYALQTLIEAFKYDSVITLSRNFKALFAKQSQYITRNFVYVNTTKSRQNLSIINPLLNFDKRCTKQLFSPLN